jgi:hypothetical protein
VFSLCRWRCHQSSLSVSTLSPSLANTLHSPLTNYVQIDIPKTHSRLERFRVGLEIASDPKLTLGVILKMVLEGQKEPLEIEGMIKAGTLSADGSL